MKQTKPAAAESAKSQMSRVVRAMRRVQPWLQGQRGKMATFGEMEQWTGVPENTIRGWFAGQGNPTAEFLLSLLERTPESVRSALFDEFCRDYATLEHPRLSGDRVVLSRLTTLLRQPRGFTYIQGGNGEARTFVISSLAHSFWMHTQPPRRVGGIDVHAPDWFVPVPGVVYLNNILPPDELSRAAKPVWPQLRIGETSLLIFNGLWSAVPELQDKIRSLADRAHVVVADEFQVETGQQARRLHPRMTLITLRSAAAIRSSFTLDIRTV